MKRITAVIMCLCMLAALVLFSACGSGQAAGSAAADTAQDQSDPAALSSALVYDHHADPQYATDYSLDYYQGGDVLITVTDGRRYLLVPRGGNVPDDLPDNVILLQQPIENIYLVASGAMDMFVAMDALDTISFAGLDADGWYIDEARAAVGSGRIRYAGKYSAPDYEMIRAGGCGLAVENTMIYHSPEIAEKLESFGIPVFVDCAASESEPLGRMEWIKLYGLITGRQEAADAAFSRQEAAFTALDKTENTGKTVAFFSITANGSVVVRKSSDYIPRMIEMAGGTYIAPDGDSGDSDRRSTQTVQMEAFYKAASDADYLIYNSAIEGGITTVSELEAKSSLLADMKAVRDGNVFCTAADMYQSSMELGTIVTDFHDMLTGRTGNMKYLYKLV